MVQISLIGLRTQEYESIRVSLFDYKNLHPEKLRIIEKNDLKTILDNGFKSIPVVMVGKKRVYFSENNYEVALSRLHTLLKERLEHTKPHKCLNCTNCNCPADRALKENAPDAARFEG